MLLILRIYIHVAPVQDIYSALAYYDVECHYEQKYYTSQQNNVQHSRRVTTGGSTHMRGTNQRIPIDSW